MRTTMCLAFLVLVSLARSASATTFVSVSDENLVGQAELIVEGRVEGSGPAAGDVAATEYVFTVERTIKGLPVRQVVVRTPGMIREHGKSLKLWGVPTFREDDRALLFLESRADGTYRVLHLALGAFHVVDLRGRRTAVRDLAGTQHATAVPDGFEINTAAPDSPRDLERFAIWAADLVAGRMRAADYFVEASEAELRRLTQAFTLFEFGGVKMRWFQFDSGGSVSFRAHNSGQQGVTGGGFSQFQAALGAWNADSATPLAYTYGGTTNADSGFDSPCCSDGINTILFNDPKDELGAFSCAGGGILAMGGPWFDPDITGVFKGETYLRIQEADIITNSGISCFFAGSSNASKAAEELFAHELGHALGIDHSCDEDSDTPEPSCSTSFAVNDALMRWLVHDDGRGGALKSDDRGALSALYATSSVPNAPTNLQAAAQSPTEMALSWQDNSTNETEFRIELKILGGSYEDIGSVPANSVGASITSLTPETAYTFRVRARNANGDSAYSNEATAATKALPGPCVADAQTVCLSSGRFRVRALWRAAGGTQAPATVAPAGSDDAGIFYFNNASNWELLLKVLNACSFASRIWVFYAATTNLELLITVTDTANGTVKVYFNPLNTPAPPVQDTGAFATCP